MKSPILSIVSIGSLANTLKTNLGKTPKDSDLEIINVPDIVGYNLLRGGKDNIKIKYFYSNRAKLDTFLI